MAEAILVPQVGQDLTEAKIVELHVKLGDTVKKGDLVAVVESEKASFDVEAFCEGVVIDLPYAEGDTATVLDPLMHLGTPGETIARGPAGTASPDMASATDTILAGPSPMAATASGVQRASPVARRMASAKGVDLARVSGTGPHGAVVLRDVEQAALAAPAAVTASGPPGIEIRTLRAGHGSPLLFLHGFGADLSSWRPMVAELPLGLPMLALDLPGHGASLGSDAADFDGLVTAVGSALRDVAGGVHLVGHSLGAAVAAALTARGDLDIRSLTLLSPAGMGPAVDGAFIDGFLAAQTEAALAAWMRRLVHDPAALAPVLVRATLEARRDPALVAAQTRIARAVFEGGTQLFSVTAALRGFGGPCTVIAGRDDAILSCADIAAQVPPQAALHRLPGVGHLPQLEAADLVRTLLTRTVRAAG